jgi:hypothetical protein
MKDNWNSLKALLRAQLACNVHYSHSREYEHEGFAKVLKWMDEIERTEEPEATIEEKEQAAAIARQLELFVIELENERS